MSPGRSLRAAVLALVGAATAACTDLASLDTEPEPLAPTERQAVRAQVDGALADGRYLAAWNQEIAAGPNRTRLETIALAALEARSRHAPDMFAALREKHGSLSAPSRARASELAAAAQAAGKWHRAMDIEVVSADDAPTYARAWRVYQSAPPERAPGLLEALLDARKEHAERASGARGPEAGNDSGTGAGG